MLTDAWPIVAGAALLLAVGAVATRELAAWLTAQRAVRLRAQAKPIVDRRIEHLAGQVETAELATILAFDLASRETAALVVGRDGRPLAAVPADAGSPPAELLDPARYAPAFAGDPHLTYVRSAGGARLLHVVVPPRAWLPDPPAVVHLVADLAAERRVLRTLSGLLAATVIAAAAVELVLQATLGGAWPLLGLAVIVPAPAIARRVLRRASADTDPRAGALPDAGPERAAPEQAISREAFTAAMRRVEAAFLARQASEERMRRFVADASHELRTPLTAVGGAADVLLRGAARDSQQVEHLARLIRGRADAMGRLVEDLLTLARLDAGVRLERAPVDLAALAREHADELRVLAPDRAITLDARPTVVVDGDATRLRQVLWNLTDNARRHGRAGGAIAITVRAEAGEVLVGVADDGPGVAEAERGRLFDRFYRGAGARSANGSGLGLAIVREIARAHGGDVSVRGAPGRGATFTVRLPAAGRPPGSADASSGNRQGGDSRATGGGGTLGTWDRSSTSPSPTEPSGSSSS